MIRSYCAQPNGTCTPRNYKKYTACTYFIVIVYTLFTLCRAESTPFPDPLSINIKQNRDRKQNGGQATQQGHGPVNPKIVKLLIISISSRRVCSWKKQRNTYHRQCKHGESCSQQGSKEGVGCNGRVRVNAITVDDIIETLLNLQSISI